MSTSTLNPAARRVNDFAQFDFSDLQVQRFFGHPKKIVSSIG